jgi:hypothetical protein
MKRYEPETPRAPFAVAAFVMTVATAAVLVVAPMHQTDTQRDAMLARVHAPATEVTIHPARIDVVAMRDRIDTWQEASARRAAAVDVQ